MELTLSECFDGRLNLQYCTGVSLKAGHLCEHNFALPGFDMVNRQTLLINLSCLDWL